MTPDLPDTSKHGIFWITRRIAIGRFATPERRRYLIEHGITDILNVSEAPSPLDENHGFQSIVDLPIIDLAPISFELAIQAIEAISKILSRPDSKLFLHCIAGQNRSPTILYVFLLSLGYPQDEAAQLITSRSPDSIPGHKLLVTPQLIEKIRELREKNHFRISEIH